MHTLNKEGLFMKKAILWICIFSIFFWAGCSPSPTPTATPIPSQLPDAVKNQLETAIYNWNTIYGNNLQALSWFVSNNVRNLLLTNTGDSFWTQRWSYLNEKSSLFKKWLDWFTSSLWIWKVKIKRRIRPFSLVNSFWYLSEELFMSRRAVDLLVNPQGCPSIHSLFLSFFIFFSFFFLGYF